MVFLFIQTAETVWITSEPLITLKSQLSTIYKYCKYRSFQIISFWLHTHFTIIIKQI